VNLRSTSDGKILVNNKGFTLYVFSRDSKNKDACVKISECTTFWPPLTTTAKPHAGPGIKASLLGTIPYKGNLKQVTYAGHPLYTYAADSTPGSTSYINVEASGGRWPALSATGNDVTGSRTPSTSTSSNTPSSSSTPSGYGY
jgi:predicted lipoprotein with Yx(FWY)xxD motif